MKIDTRQIFSIHTEEQFNALSIAIFHYQRANNPTYKAYLELLNRDVEYVNHYREIPFLPINFFKTHRIVNGAQAIQITFSSSGTSGHQDSKHEVTDVAIYEQSYQKAFQLFYGEVRDYCILALLPSYLERTGSSLIYMIDDLLQKSTHPQSGYFLHNHHELYQTLVSLKENKQKTLLIGVTYALLDFAEQYKIDFPDLIVMETGGMKGKRKEMIRPELHQLLCSSFGVSRIHSEYGMTELLSQAYSAGNGLFACPPWMKILLREANDPLSLVENNHSSGGINVIDLANINSCSFIATQDLGKIHTNGNFEVLGRFDNADIRGCNLLVQ